MSTKDRRRVPTSEFLDAWTTEALSSRGTAEGVATRTGMTRRAALRRASALRGRGVSLAYLADESPRDVTVLRRLASTG